VRKRWIQTDSGLVEVTPDYKQAIPADAAHGVVADIEPYQSMVDGSLITSRRAHREHLKRHNVIEIGNEKIEPKPRRLPEDPRRKQIIAAKVDQYGEDRLRKDARAIGEWLKWNSRGR